MKITTLNTQRKNNLNLVNFTHRKILFSIFIKQFIHFPRNKTFTRKRRTKNDSNQHCSFGPTKKSARPASLARALPAPRLQPGLGPAKPRGRAHPHGPAGGPVNLEHSFSFDGRVSISQDQITPIRGCP